MKLTSISEHSDLLQQLVITMSERWYFHRKRVAFGRQTLNISMFIPAKLIDGEWVVLDDVFYLKNETVTHELLNEYEMAKSTVLFEGFEARKGKAIHLIEFWINDNFLFTYNSSCKYFLMVGSTVENLVTYNLTLTNTAKKQIGL